MYSIKLIGYTYIHTRIETHVDAKLYPNSPNCVSIFWNISQHNVQELPSPPHTPHTSYSAFEPRLPSQPMFYIDWDTSISQQGGNATCSIYNSTVSLISWKLTKQLPPMHRPSLYPSSVGVHGVPSFILPRMVQNLPSTARHTREHLLSEVPKATAGRRLIVKHCQTNCQLSNKALH